MKSPSPPPSVGRPRKFDTDTALDQAMHVFWEKGFEAASLSDLTEAMGINRPSLYAAFGNKEELFRKALERYATGPASNLALALKEPTLPAVVTRLLNSSVEHLGDPTRPRGCMVVQGALCGGEEAESARRQALQLRLQSYELMRERFEQGQAAGELPPDAVAADLARFLVVVLNGLSIQATNGATREQMQRVAEIAIKAFPFPATPQA